MRLHAHFIVKIDNLSGLVLEMQCPIPGPIQWTGNIFLLYLGRHMARLTTQLFVRTKNTSSLLNRQSSDTTYTVQPLHTSKVKKTDFCSYHSNSALFLRYDNHMKLRHV